MNTSMKGQIMIDLCKAQEKDSKIPFISLDWELRESNVTDEYLKKYYTVDLTRYNENELEALKNFFASKKECANNVKHVEKWIACVKDPLNAEIKNISSLSSVFEKLVQKKKSKIFFLKQDDGTFYPVLLEQAKSEHDREEGESYFSLKFSFYRIKLKSGSRWDDDDNGDPGKAKLEKHDIRRYFYKNDLLKNSEDIFNDNSECLSLIDLLAKEHVYMYDEEYMQAYKLELENFLNIVKHVGKQYVAKGKSIIQTGWWFWSESMFSDIDTKVIIEEIDSDILNKCYTFEKKIGLKNEPVPFHPYVKCYDLINHRYILTSASCLTAYKYDKEMIKRLIIDDSIKDIISIIVNSDNTYNDFIKGKSKGRIIMSTGEPGLGKTLTAEVYSEAVERPLYKIQSAQLGDNAKDIEKNLKNILSNAYRWKCILLIDEADTYVRKRGNDIIQNCIIGVFLRLLEYYEGILFMTSNKGDEIDDAILSRCTIHIKYQYPDKKQAAQIFQQLAEINKMEIDKKEVEKIVAGYEKLSGRSIGVIVKNLSKLSQIKKQKPTHDLFKTVEKFIYLADKV